MHYAALTAVKRALQRRTLPKYFPLLISQFYVCGILISWARAHVLRIKLVWRGNHPSPLPLLQGEKISDTSPLVLSFSALVSDTLAIRHGLWQDLNELSRRCGLLSRDVKCRQTTEPERCSRGRNLKRLPVQNWRSDNCATRYSKKFKKCGTEHADTTALLWLRLQHGTWVADGTHQTDVDIKNLSQLWLQGLYASV